jgi:hypothetical protein
VREEFWESGTWFVFMLALAAVVALADGCVVVHSATACVTYDHSLGRVDPNVGVARDATGASVCAEVGPRE